MLGVGFGSYGLEVEASGMCLELGAEDSLERKVWREVNPSKEKEGRGPIL